MTEKTSNSRLQIFRGIVVDKSERTNLTTKNSLLGSSVHQFISHEIWIKDAEGNEFKFSGKIFSQCRVGHEVEVIIDSHTSYLIGFKNITTGNIYYTEVIEPYRYSEREAVLSLMLFMITLIMSGSLYYLVFKDPGEQVSTLGFVVCSVVFGLGLSFALVMPEATRRGKEADRKELMQEVSAVFN